MESEFLLVWVPTAWLHRAALGVTLSFVTERSIGRARAGDRAVLQWPHRAKLSRRAQLCPDLATPICVTLGEFLTLPSLPSNSKKQMSLYLPSFWWTCLVARKGSYFELA